MSDVDGVNEYDSDYDDSGGRAFVPALTADSELTRPYRTFTGAV